MCKQKPANRHDPGLDSYNQCSTGYGCIQPASTSYTSLATCTSIKRPEHEHSYTTQPSPTSGCSSHLTNSLNIHQLDVSQNPNSLRPPLLLASGPDGSLRLAKPPRRHLALEQLIELTIRPAFAFGEEEEQGETGQGGERAKEESCLLGGLVQGTRSMGTAWGRPRTRRDIGKVE